MKPANYSDLNLIWLDLEMTGLIPETDRVIEIATIVTDAELNILAEGPTIAIYQPQSALDAMDEWNQTHHGSSGLVDRVIHSTYTEETATDETINFLQQYVAAGKSPMCGNSICQDRRFMARHMPRLEAYFHYRNLDVSTLKELVARWQPDLLKGFSKKGAHLAMDDIKDSIAELVYYREHCLNI
jgi:oligoribonuclease